MCRTFLILIWCSVMQPGLQQVLNHTLSWNLVTYPPVFGQAIELRCTVTGAACCNNFTRIWSKGATQIIANGVTSMPAKYSEALDAANNQFSLIIRNLSESDLNVVYTCSYLNDSPAKSLTQDARFEYYPPTDI